MVKWRKTVSRGELVVFFSNNDILVEILGVFKINREKPQNQKSHERSYDVLCTRLSGKGEFKTNEKTFSVGRGDLLYIPKSLDYSQKTAGETIIAVHFFCYGSKPNLSFEIFSSPDTADFEELFLEMYGVWNEKKAGYKHKCTALFYELLSRVSRRQYATAINAVTSDVKIKKAIDFIHANYRKEEILISELAKICSVSEPYFRKLFKQIHGISPSRYIINLRLEFAYHLLRSRLYTVSEAGYKAGFNDIKYFSKLFKNHYGCSPKSYK